MQNDTNLLMTLRNDLQKLLQADRLKAPVQVAQQCWWSGQIFVLARRLAVGILVNFALVRVLNYWSVHVVQKLYKI